MRNFKDAKTILNQKTYYFCFFYNLIDKNLY